LAIAVKRYKADASKENTEQVKRMRSELNRIELERYAELCDRFPQEIPLKFELGKRLKTAGNWSEAAEQFELCKAEKKFAGSAMLEKGDCLRQNNLYQAALAEYEKAIDTAKTEKEVEIRMAALYLAGRLAEFLKNIIKAEKHYTMLYEFSSDYKDVKQRLDKIREIRNKESLSQ